MITKTRIGCPITENMIDKAEVDITEQKKIRNYLYQRDNTRKSKTGRKIHRPNHETENEGN
jgi:hypothetical protein